MRHVCMYEGIKFADIFLLFGKREVFIKKTPLFTPNVRAEESVIIMYSSETAAVAPCDDKVSNKIDE